MTITFTGLDLGFTAHGTPVMSQWESPMMHHQFFGVVGEATLYGENKQRTIAIEGHLSKFDSMAAILIHQNHMAKLRGKSGDLVINRGDGDAVRYHNCLFLSIDPHEPPFLDGSGVNGWVMRVSVTWRQSANEQSNQTNSS